MSQIETRPGTQSTAITGNDGADVAVVPRGLHVNAEVTLSMVLQDDPAGASPKTYVLGPGLWPYRPRRIYATGTTMNAGDVIGIA